MITAGKFGSRPVAPRANAATRKTELQRECERREKAVRRAASLLKQISDPTRLQVIRELADGEKHVGAFCEGFNATQAAVSHHLALLRLSGLIIPHRKGKNNLYALTESGQVLAEVVKAMTID
jgi:DNA-binding transcriptional ArsR family regulator